MALRGHCTLGCVSAPTRVEGWRVTVQAIHPPLITISDAPTGCVIKDHPGMKRVEAVTPRPSSSLPLLS